MTSMARSPADIGNNASSSLDVIETALVGEGKRRPAAADFHRFIIFRLVYRSTPESMKMMRSRAGHDERAITGGLQYLLGIDDANSDSSAFADRLPPVISCEIHMGNQEAHRLHRLPAISSKMRCRRAPCSSASWMRKRVVIK